MRDAAVVENVLNAVWSGRVPHLHGLALFVSVSNPDHFRVDVETDTRNGHFEHTRDVDRYGHSHRHVRSGRHLKPGRINVDHLHPTLWALHTKHLYYDATSEEDDVRSLIEAGIGLLHDMAHQKPDPSHHAKIDRDDIALASEDWRLLWRLRVSSET